MLSESLTQSHKASKPRHGGQYSFAVAIQNPISILQRYVPRTFNKSKHIAIRLVLKNMGRQSMRIRFLSVCVLVGLAANACKGPVKQRALEGRGVLSPPATVPERLSETASQDAFVANTSGLYSRTVFATTQDPDFNIAIRDFSVPPKTGPLTLRLESPAALEKRSGQGIIKVANESSQIRQDSIISVPMGASIELENPNEQELIVRIYSVEAKQR